MGGLFVGYEQPDAVSRELRRNKCYLHEYYLLI